MSKTVITYGTFDLFHVGHVRLLRRLRSLGSRLVVGISTDEFNSLKGKKCIIPYEERREILLSCRYVDEVFAESSWDQKINDIKEFSADIFAMGDDWQGKFDFLKDYTKVVYLPRTDGISTTEIKHIMDDLNKDRLRNIRDTIENALSEIDRIYF